MLKAIYLDMDGVMAAFTLGLMSHYGIHDKSDSDIIEWDCFSILGIDEVRFWQEVTASFWAGLPQYIWAGELERVCRNHGPVYFLTSPGGCAQAAEGKFFWLQERGFVEKPSEMIVTGQKHLLSSRGTVLIDDSPTNCEKFEQLGEGYSFLWPMPWNTKNRDPWPQTLRRLDDYLRTAGDMQ